MACPQTKANILDFGKSLPVEQTTKKILRANHIFFFQNNLWHYCTNNALVFQQCRRRLGYYAYNLAFEKRILDCIILVADCPVSRIDNSYSCYCLDLAH